MFVIKRSLLEKLYVRDGQSMQEIANILNCSVHKVAYWMNQHNINRRSISDAVYMKLNPDGDPFFFS